MKIRYIYLVATLFFALISVQCITDKDNAIYQDRCNDGIKNGDETGIDCGGSCEPCEEQEMFYGQFIQEDQMGRPATNILFNKIEFRDSLNVTLPYLMKDQFKEIFEQRIFELDTSFTTNVLGLTAGEMAEIFSADVLWVSETGITSYNNGTEILTGRALGEDVMDSNLLWMFGGPDGTKNNDDPNLVSDNVDENDAEFLSVFPYLAPPFDTD